MISEALRNAGAPEEMVEGINSPEKEGSGLFEATWGAWQSISSELKTVNDPPDLEQVWSEVIEYYVHDTVIDLLAEYRNPASGASEPLQFSDEKLATRVVAVLKGERVDPPKKKPTSIIDMVNVIDQEMSGVGAWVKCYPPPLRESKSTHCTIVIERGTSSKVSRVLDEVLSRSLGFDSSNQRFENKQASVLEYDSHHAIVTVEQASQKEIKLGIYLKT